MDVIVTSVRQSIKGKKILILKKLGILTKLGFFDKKQGCLTRHDGYQNSTTRGIRKVERTLKND